MHIREDIFDTEKQLIQADKFHAISRLRGVGYGNVRDRFDMPRPKLTEDGEVVTDSHLIIRKYKI